MQQDSEKIFLRDCRREEPTRNWKIAEKAGAARKEGEQIVPISFFERFSTETEGRTQVVAKRRATGRPSGNLSLPESIPVVSWD